MRLQVYKSLFCTFFKIGGILFGGGLAMLPLLEREIVNKKKWVTEDEILDIYGIGQCTPGIIAVNTATFIGYRQGGFLGSLFATLGLITPSLFIICLIASILQNFLHIPWLLHALSGIRLIVCAMMIRTVRTLATKGIVDWKGGFIFLSTLLLACFTKIPTAFFIIGSALTGILIQTGKKQRSSL